MVKLSIGRRLGAGFAVVVMAACGALGAAWWQFLDRACEAGRFTNDVGPMLDRCVYDDEFATSLSRDQLDHLLGAAEYWIEHHDRDLARC